MYMRENTKKKAQREEKGEKRTKAWEQRKRIFKKVENNWYHEQNPEINSFQKDRESYEPDIHICNKIYYYVQAFILQERKNKKKQSKNARRANGLKMLMS